MQAIILAGGFGTRLQSVVKDVPKPMADIKNLPFLSYLFTYLKNHNITDVVLSVGYLQQKIVDYFGNSYLGINIKYAIEIEPLGTGGAIVNSLKFVDQNQPVIVLNGDTFLQIDYKKLINFYVQKESDLTIVLRHLKDCSRYGSVKIDDKNHIVSFAEKNVKQDYANESNLINGGIYVINPKLFAKYNLAKSFSFEQEFLSPNLKKINPSGFVVNDYFIDIGIPEDYQRAIDELPKIIKNKALFLDRDGVINIDYGHVGKIADFHFIEGIFKLCQRAHNAGYLIIIVTNQAGIAKGYYTEEQFLKLTKWMEGEFLKNGIKIAKTYYCPYHIEGKVEKYREDSFDRKPNPGMLLKAIAAFNIDPQSSIMIGDRQTDMMAAENAMIGSKILFKDQVDLLNLSF